MRECSEIRPGAINRINEAVGAGETDVTEQISGTYNQSALCAGISDRHGGASVVKGYSRS